MDLDLQLDWTHMHKNTPEMQQLTVKLQFEVVYLVEAKTNDQID